LSKSKVTIQNKLITWIWLGRWLLVVTLNFLVLARKYLAFAVLVEYIYLTEVCVIAKTQVILRLSRIFGVLWQGSLVLLRLCSKSFFGNFTWCEQSQTFQNSWWNLERIQLWDQPFWVYRCSPSTQSFDVLKHHKCKLTLNLFCAPRIESCIKRYHRCIFK
jgi:hypothetical protein